MEEFFERLNNFHKKYFRFVLMALLIGVTLLVLRVLPYAAALMLPFIIGYVISLAASPLVKLLKKRLKIPYKAGAAITVLILLSIVTLAVIFLIGLISDFSGAVVDNWDDLYSSFTDYIKTAADTLERFSDSLPFDFFEVATKSFDGIEIKSDGGFDLGKSLANLLSPFAGSLAGGTVSVVKSLPEALIFIVMLILSTYFFTGSRDKMRSFYERNAPEALRDKMRLIKTECFGALFGYLKAQVILSCISAALLTAGFLLLGVRHAFLIALITAFIDMLPVFGTGTVLIPWAIINLFTDGGLFFTIGMLVLYVICLSVRNLLQPKVLSQNIGLNPIATLITIWIGYKLYGFLGMILLPIAALLVYKLYEIGIFDWFFIKRRSAQAEK